MNNRTIGFFAFIIIFVAAIFGIQYYCLNRLSFLFDFDFVNTVYFLILILSFAPIIATILSKVIWNDAVKLAYIFALTYMGSLWIFFMLLLIHHLVTLFFPLSLRVMNYAVFVLFVILLVYSVAQAKMLSMKKVIIPTNKVKDYFRIVQISDTHLGAKNNGNFMKRVVKKVNLLKPDVVVLTGDIFDGTGRVSSKTIDSFNDIEAPSFFIFGNHETYSNQRRLFNMLAKTPFEILKDERVDFNGIRIIGLDDPGHDRRKNVDKILKKIDSGKKKFNLLLSHRPIHFKHMEKYDIDLQLSGHTHGGQMFPLNLMIKPVYRNMKGLYKKKGKYTYVSVGTSTWGPSMRLGSKSELTLIILKNKTNL